MKDFAMAFLLPFSGWVLGLLAATGCKLSGVPFSPWAWIILGAAVAWSVWAGFVSARYVQRQRDQMRRPW